MLVTCSGSVLDFITGTALLIGITIVALVSVVVPATLGAALLSRTTSVTLVFAAVSTLVS